MLMVIGLKTNLFHVSIGGLVGNIFLRKNEGNFNIMLVFIALTYSKLVLELYSSLIVQLNSRLIVQLKCEH